MTTPRPDHFFEQADRLVVRPTVGAPRQVDLRRAISSAYYGLFHFVMRSVADEFVGGGQRNSLRYALVYRSVDHRALRDLCGEAVKSTLSAKYKAFVPAGGFDADIQAFARAAIGLQDKRHGADYDPRASFRMSDAKLVILEARNAIARFQRANDELRASFLTLLAFPPR